MSITIDLRIVLLDRSSMEMHTWLYDRNAMHIIYIYIYKRKTQEG